MSSSHAATDQAVLTGRAYRTQDDLAARQRLYDHQHPRYDLPGIVTRLLTPRRPRIVADIGCGNGTYTTRLRDTLPQPVTVVGIDLAAGILAPVPPPTTRADAAALPLTDHTCQAVLAMHMLYHVADIDTAVNEFARVLDPDGILVTSTNARDDKHELDDLWTAAASDILGTPDPPRRIKLSQRHPLEETADVLSPHFTGIHTRHLTGVITVTEPAPVTAHLASYRSFAADTGIPFTETLTRATQLLTQHLQDHGSYTITCHNGITTARPRNPNPQPTLTTTT